MSSSSFHFKSARLPDLDDIRKFLGTNAAEMGARPDAVDELVLAVNEAITNILVHGYHSQPGNIEMAVEREGHKLIVILGDHAPLFDPTQAPAADVTSPLDQRPPGGLGIHMMRQLTDELIYRVTNDGENQLWLVKHHAIPDQPVAADATANQEDPHVA